MCTSKEEAEVFVSLAQEDGREKDSKGAYEKYPFKNRIIRTMLFVFELPAGKDSLTEYGDPKPLYKEQPKVLHEISIRFKAKPNTKYIIIPSTRVAGETSTFSMSFYTSVGMLEFDVKRVDDPSDRCK